MNEPIRVLLVDDQPSFTAVLVKRLVRRGMMVAAASDGDEALGLMQSTPFDVAVLDVQMPIVNGVQLLKIVRKRHPGVAVILLTGHGTMNDALRSQEAGAFGFLFKPVSLDLLEDTIQRAAGSLPTTWENLRD